VADSANVPDEELLEALAAESQNPEVDYTTGGNDL
jgi:hypothetical protein